MRWLQPFPGVFFGIWLCLGPAPLLAESTPEPVTALTAINLDEWHQQLETWQPKIVVVDYWATWCSSCLERFPKMVELAQRFGRKGVQFVGLNLDDPNDAGSVELARKFLKKVNAEFPQYHITDNLKQSFERLNLLGIPVVTIHDGSGAEVKRLTGDNPNNQFTDEDIEQALVELLAAAPDEA